MRRPTINDVARLAGVSKRTVSRVLNNQGPTKKETRERVLAAMQQLNYTPNALARRLAQGQTGILGVFAYEAVFPTEREDFFYPFLEGIEIGAQRLGYDLLLFTQAASTQPEGGRSVYAGGRNRTQLAEGLVLLGSNPNRQDLVRLYQEKVPFVTIGRRVAGSTPISWVTADYAQIFYRVTEKLIGLGHRRIGLVLNNPEFEADADKYAGYHRALSEAGIIPDEQWLVSTRDPRRIAAHFLSQEEPVTAILHTNNGVAGPLYSELRCRGIQVPRDISLVSFDAAKSNVENFQLAYIEMPKQQMGEQAVVTLVELIKRGRPGETIQLQLPCTFFPGQSIGPAPKS